MKDSKVEYLVFDEIIRDLVVSIKGRVLLLDELTDEKEIKEQTQEMVNSLKDGIRQLEEAAYQNASAETEIKQLKEQLNNTLELNNILEESAKIQNQTLEELTTQLDEQGKKLSDQEKKLAEEKQVNAKLVNDLRTIANDNTQEAAFNAEIEKLKSDLEKANSEIKQYQQEINTIRKDNFVAISELTECQKQLEAAEDISTRPEYIALKNQLAPFESAQSENKALKLRLLALEHELENHKENVDANSKRELIEANAKIEKLSQELSNTEKLVSILHSKNEQSSTVLEENQKLKDQILDLQIALQSIMKAQEETESKFRGKFALSSEDCVNLYETLSSARSRLEHSLENKDLYKKVCDSIVLFENSNAIHQIATVGHVYNPVVHKVVKTYLYSELPDNTIISEVSSGLTCGEKLIHKARVAIVKSRFVCTDCGNYCKPHEYFCPKCGLELTSPDGAGKRTLVQLPMEPNLILPLIDAFIKQSNVDEARKLLNKLSQEHPGDLEISKRQNLFELAERVKL